MKNKKIILIIVIVFLVIGIAYPQEVETPAKDTTHKTTQEKPQNEPESDFNEVDYQTIVHTISHKYLDSYSTCHDWRFSDFGDYILAEVTYKIDGEKQNVVCAFTPLKNDKFVTHLFIVDGYEFYNDKTCF